MTPDYAIADPEPLPPVSCREIRWILVLLLVASVARVPGIFTRAAWYDEMISLVETSGYSSPHWPRLPAPAGESRRFFTDTASPAQVYEVLLHFDIHPPLYFLSLCLWRHLFGPSIEAARFLSFFFSMASVLVLYVLLRWARVEQARLATLVYALSTGAAHSGHEARPYALAELALLGGALAAYVAAVSPPRRALASTLVMAAALGAACHTLYVAGFTAAAVLAWFTVRLWRRSRATALVGVTATACLVVLAIPLLNAQQGEPPQRLSIDLRSEVVTLVELNMKNLGVSMAGSAEATTEGWGAALGWVQKLAFLALIGVGAFHAWRRHKAGERIWSLLAVLAVAPTLGVFAVNMALGQRIHQPRYVVFAVAALATVAATGLLSLRGPRRWGLLLLGALLLVQASRVNWGFERCVRDQTGGIKRSLASVIDGYESPGRLVLIGAGWGVGDPASWIYELQPETLVAVFDWGADRDAMLRAAAAYPDLWVTFSTDKVTLGAEQEVLRRLRTSGAYQEVFANPLVSHFVRVGR